MKKIISVILCLTILCSIMIYTANAENILNDITIKDSDTFSVTEINLETKEKIIRTFDKVETPQLSEMKPFELPLSKSMSSRTIIGDDERTKVEDTTVYPYSAIVFLEITWGLFNKKCATGFMISDNVVVTSAHALYKKTYDGIPKLIKAYPAKYGLINPYGSASAKAVGVCTEFVEYIDNSRPENGNEWPYPYEDWGVVILDEPLGRETGTISLKCPTNDELNDLKTSEGVNLCGYGASSEILNIYHQYENSGSISAYSSDLIEYALDAIEGQSGSPVLNKDNFAIGIHFGAYNDYNCAVRMDENMMYYFNKAIEDYKEN